LIYWASGNIPIGKLISGFGVLLTKLNKQPGRHLEIGGKGLIVLINVNYCCPALDIR
jgi:hypothetical protein